MKFATLADLHGNLPGLSGLDFDALLIAGDICPTRDHAPGFQADWIDTKFRRWLAGIGKPVYGIAGNHDFIFEKRPDLVPADLPWVYLQDSGATLPNGLRIWGSPWTPYFGGWAFNLHDDRFCGDLAEKWALIPEGTDVLLTHGPPYGHGDAVADAREHVGSRSLLDRVERVYPKLMVFGHIHEGYGEYRLCGVGGGPIVVNAAHVDERYRPVNQPIIVEIKGDGE